MSKLGTLGPEGTYSWQAAKRFDPNAEIVLFNTISSIFDAFEGGIVKRAIVPIYNTIDKEIPDSFNRLKKLQPGCWIVDNLVLPIRHALGTLDSRHQIELLMSKDTVFRQCEKYISKNLPNAAMKPVSSTAQAIDEIRQKKLHNAAVIASKGAIESRGLVVRDEDLVKNNRTRFAVLGSELSEPTGYDGTAIITTPLRDRVGLLHDMLEEFELRNINLLDVRSDTDEETQRLLFYIEMEGHIREGAIPSAIEGIKAVIEDPGSVKILGSYPRVDMREKKIGRIGFIGTGDMSGWFQQRLEREGYKIYLTGRTTELRPEEMIPQVDVVIPCVPISAGKAVLEECAPLLKPKQALIVLAGETTETLKTAIENVQEGVEVMGIHNLWGPKAGDMKGKNAIVVKTERSGELCQEFENFLYKHGARVTHDTPRKHDIMIGVEQKLPTAVSIALASVLKQYGITSQDIRSHSTLTSIYSILAMARIHAQSPGTYAEILSSNIEGTKMVKDFLRELSRIKEIGEKRDIETLKAIIKENAEYLGKEFLEENLNLTREVDKLLGKRDN